MFFRRNKTYFLLYGILLFSGITFRIFYSKGEAFKILNFFHHNYLDYVFRFFTFLGDGWFIIALAVLLFIFKKKRLALLVFSSYALSGLIAMALKYSFDAPRPATYFEHSDYKMMFDLNELMTYRSFPSGHTTSAFALATILAMYFKDKRWAPLLILYACLVGYSRIYLAQHFLLDVICGSLIGVFSAMICWYVFILRRPK